MNKIFKKSIIFITALLIVFGMAVACSEPAGYYDTPDQGSGEEGGGILHNGSIPQDRKIAYSAYITIEAADIAEAMEDIEQLIAQYNAVDQIQSYVASAELDYSRQKHSAQMVIRVSAQRLDEFLDSLGQMGQVISKRKSSEDLSSQYANYDAEKQALETELELLHEAHQNAQDPAKSIYYLERITEVNTRLNQIISAMNTIDDRVTLSKVYLSIYGKGQSPIEESFPTTAGKVFFGSLEAMLAIGKFFLLTVIALGPFVVVIGAIVTAALTPVIVSKRKKQKESDNAKKDQNLSDN